MKINEGEDLDNMKTSLKEIGFKITKNNKLKERIAEIIINSYLIKF